MPLKRRITVFIGLITLSIIALVASTAYAATIGMPTGTGLNNIGAGQATLTGPFDVTDLSFNIDVFGTFPTISICIDSISITIDNLNSTGSFDLFLVLTDGTNVLGLYQALNQNITSGPTTITLQPQSSPDTKVCGLDILNITDIELYAGGG